MSDFISRLAARAVGQATVAQPRPDLLFADVEPVPPEVEPVEPVEPAHVIADPAALRETLSRVEAASVLRHTEHLHSTSERTSVEREHVEAIHVVTETAAAVERLRERQAEPAPAEPSPTSAVARVDAVAAVPRALEAVPLLPVAREEPVPEQPVRVHIGRLEIRATVHDDPKPKPVRRTQRRADGLSLGEYLRGGR